MSKKRSLFEERISEIDLEIHKRRHKWSLTAISWMDFSDVAQILRIHIYKKWHMYDEKMPLAPWINRIISNQIRNLIRNNYGNFSRPCLKCSAFEGENLCSIYGKQSTTCSLFAKWQKSKKNAYDTKLPVSLENHSQEVFNMKHDVFNIEATSQNLHSKMEKTLKPIEWKFYNLAYIAHKSEEEIAKIMGYKSSEKNRLAGYKQIRNLKKIIIQKAKKYIYNGDIDIV